MGGGQDEGDAAAARASCLLHVMEIFFVFPPCGPCQQEGLIPLGYWWVYEWQCAACRVLYHLTGTASVFLSEL